MLWRWLVFNTHFGWQHQTGTQQVKQISLACSEASSEPALKLLSMQLPLLVCDFLTPITEHGRSIYLCVRLTPHVPSYLSDRWSPSLTKNCYYFVILKVLLFCGWYTRGNKNGLSGMCDYTCSHIYKLAFQYLAERGYWFVIWFNTGRNLYFRLRALLHPQKYYGWGQGC